MLYYKSNLQLYLDFNLNDIVHQKHTSDHTFSSNIVEIPSNFIISYQISSFIFLINSCLTRKNEKLGEVYKGRFIRFFFCVPETLEIKSSTMFLTPSSALDLYCCIGMIDVSILLCYCYATLY